MRNLLEFPGGVFGIAFNLDEDEIGVLLLGDYAHLEAGAEVERTSRVMDIGVGDALLGRVLDPLGRPLDTASARSPRAVVCRWSVRLPPSWIDPP